MLEFGENLRQMADVKYALDDNTKQNFLEPLHHLQMKELKEVMVNFFITVLCFYIKSEKSFIVKIKELIFKIIQLKFLNEITCNFDIFFDISYFAFK